MSDPDSDYSPPKATGGIARPAEVDPHEAAKGSVWTGFGIGWLVLGPEIAIRLALAHVAASEGWFRLLQGCALGLLGWLAVRFAMQGKSRVVIGTVTAFGTSLAVGALLALARNLLDG